MADGGENLANQAERWPWFIDILFGIVATKGIEKYAEQFLGLWPQGILPVLQSLVVAAGIASFVVYDIAIYHVLVRRFRFTFSRKGFVRLGYWTVPALAWWGLPLVIGANSEARAQLLLLLACLTIGGVSWFRWGQVLKRFEEPKASRH